MERKPASSSYTRLNIIKLNSTQALSIHLRDLPVWVPEHPAYPLWLCFKPKLLIEVYHCKCTQCCQCVLVMHSQHQAPQPTICISKQADICDVALKQRANHLLYQSFAQPLSLQADCTESSSLKATFLPMLLNLVVCCVPRCLYLVCWIYQYIPDCCIEDMIAGCSS